MNGINLLPHRQIKRAERQRQFGLMALFTAVLASAIVFAGWTYIGAKKQKQLDRNARLERAITQLDIEIADINRSQAVVVLDEIARQLPEGLFLKSMQQTGNVITLQGVADTNARVATLVRNLEVSNALESPVLVEIKTSTVNNVKQNHFILKVNLKVQKAEQATAGV